MIEALDESLVGMSAGKTKTFTAPLAGGDREGEDSQVTVTLQSVKERELPEADDEFAQLASSFDTVEELKADLLVAGGGRHGVLGRVSLGSVGQTLLNSSTVPVALSPRGMRHAPLDGLSRITVMLGESGRWRGVLSKARTFADRAGVPLRLVTVATGDSQDTAEIEKRTEALLVEIADPGDLEDGLDADQLQGDVGHGRDDPRERDGQRQRPTGQPTSKARIIRTA